MKVNEILLQNAMSLLNAHQQEVNSKADEILSIGCSWCGMGCSGIVGG